MTMLEGTAAGVAPAGQTAPAGGIVPPPRTTVPARPSAPTAQIPRRTGGLRATDVFAILSSLAAAITATGILWLELGPFSGLLGYVVVSWVLFVACYTMVTAFDESGPTVRSRVASLVVHSIGALLLVVVAFVIGYTVWRGFSALIHVNFYTEDLRSTGPLDPLTKGGVVHAMVGTLLEVGIALGVSVPLALLAAVFLHEVPGRFARFVRTVVEAMTALPDILAGLFIYATLILIFGIGLSGLAAACALAVTILPIIIRASDVVFRLVPGSLKEASYALGSTQWRTVRHVLLPTARSGLATAVILGAARAIGETSPVLLTAGATGYLNFNPAHGAMMSLPLLAYTQVQSSQEAEVARGFGAAATLLALVILLFAIARTIGGRAAGDLTSGQQRRRAVQSRRDLNRYLSRRAMYPGTGAVTLNQKGADR
jgi:phosphate transport system permease protein